jgi:hypothetical protein
VDGTGSGCPILGFSISDVEPSNSANRVYYTYLEFSSRLILGKLTVRMGDGWNWLRIVSSCGL